MKYIFMLLMLTIVGCSSTSNYPKYTDIRYACVSDSKKTMDESKTVERCLPVDMSIPAIYWHGYRPWDKVDYELPEDMP